MQIDCHVLEPRCRERERRILRRRESLGVTRSWTPRATCRPPSQSSRRSPSRAPTSSCPRRSSRAGGPTPRRSRARRTSSRSTSCASGRRAAGDRRLARLLLAAAGQPARGPSESSSGRRTLRNREFRPKTMAMTERNRSSDPRRRWSARSCLRGPNVTSTFDTPPAPTRCRCRGPRSASICTSAAGRGRAAADPLRPPGRLERQLDHSAVTPCSPTASVSPGAASRRTSASAIVPSRGESTALLTCPTGRSPSRSSSPGRRGPDRRRQHRSPQVAVGLAPVVQARHGLLADVAALREAHRALVEAGLLGDHAARRCPRRSGGGRARRARSPRRLADRVRAALDERLAQRLGVGGVAQHVDAGVGGARSAARERPAICARRVGVLDRGGAVGSRRRALRRAPRARGRSARAGRAPACACAARRS